MLSRVRLLSNGKGFTLIEILIVIAIIGILAAIAIPQFNQYKERASNSAIKADLHNLYLACKTYWLNNTSSDECGLSTITQANYGFIHSPGVTLVITNGTENTFSARANHASSSNSYSIDSQGKISAN